MHLQIFSCSPANVELWKEVCQHFVLNIETTDRISSTALASGPQSRLLIFDQSLLSDDVSETAELFRAQSQNVIGVVCGKPSVESAVQYMRLGAEWIFSEPLSATALTTGLRCLLEVSEQRNSVYQEFLKLRGLAETITQREWEVVELVLDGTPNKNIAKRLNISVRTVEARRTKVYRKFGVKNVTGLIRSVDRAAELKKQFQYVLPEVQAVAPRTAMKKYLATANHPAA